ncbi:hypothetical protein Taro_037693 [Colocasia esculenta]|uniref:Uncharacterized protein n=1 Tax=Colocasia esculenta TaxID=4460 RepID=A0A843WDK7_COLES|nr:hypothetical protein [Colocasia esculenta]
MISRSPWAMLCNLIFRIFLEFSTNDNFYLICTLEVDPTALSWIRSSFLCLEMMELERRSTRGCTNREENSLAAEKLLEKSWRLSSALLLFTSAFVGVPAALDVRDWLFLLSLVCEAQPPYFLQLFEFIAYLTGLNSNPSGSSDPWVAARPSGSLAGGPGGRVVIVVASLPAGFKCELQESVADVARCACYEPGCWFACAVVGFVVSLRVRLGVSRRLREPTCSVCCVALLVERCDTCLWLLSALCWLVLNSSEVLPKFFSVGSGGSEVSPELRCARFWLLSCCPLG